MVTVGSHGGWMLHGLLLRSLIVMVKKALELIRAALVPRPSATHFVGFASRFSLI